MHKRYYGISEPAAYWNPPMVRIDLDGVESL
jgi:hypothetical protein